MINNSKSIVKNYIFNVFYQILVIILPIITMPYISRVLGAEKIGEYSFTFSISQYFVLLAILGTNIYGCRIISYSRTNEGEMSNSFWSIYIIKIITFIVSLALYFLVLFFFIDSNKMIYYLQGINILAVLLDITWFYQGIEEFGSIVLKNTFIKVISIALIFILVKEPSDIYIYTLVLSVSTLVGNLILWINISKYLLPLKKCNINIKKHIIPIIKLFIPQIAIQVYVVLDKTMLGGYSTAEQVAYYDMAIKIIKISLTVVTSLGIVMLPRIANEFKKGENEKIKGYINNSMVAMLLIAIPMMFGFIGISKEFISLFLGNEFIETAKIMRIISPILIFMTISNVIGVQCMIPMGYEQLLTKSVVIAAIVNFTMNVYLIPKYGAVGASISTVFAEGIVAIIQYILIRRYIKIEFLAKDITKILVASIGMLIIINQLMKLNINIILIIFFSILFYFFSIIIMKISILQEYLIKIKNRVRM